MIRVEICYFIFLLLIIGCEKEPTSNPDAAISASEILFLKGEAAVDGLKKMTEQNFEDVFEGVPQAEITLSELETGISIIDILSAKTNFLKSGGEARRALKENSISVNKAKIEDDAVLNTSDLIYIKRQRYYLSTSYELI